MNVLHLMDYQGRFGSKHDDSPYRSGFNLELLKNEYEKIGIHSSFVPFTQINLVDKDYSGQYITYTSTEDPGYHYKSFIEDIVLSLELAGARMIPKYSFLRATNNKVFMEKLRELYFSEEFDKFNTQTFGCADELINSKMRSLQFPVIVKTAEGSSGHGVFLAQNEIELSRIVKKISRTRNYSHEIWDIGRASRHKGYKKESLFRKKYIVQKFVAGLKNDWKILVYGQKYYIVFRPVLEHRKFKASGCGLNNCNFGTSVKFPIGIFDFAKQVFDKLNVPHVSLDIAFDGQKFYLLEFQCVFFGTSGVINSDCYYTNPEGKKWLPIFDKLSIENVYASSIKEYIDKNYQS